MTENVINLSVDDILNFSKKAKKSFDGLAKSGGNRSPRLQATFLPEGKHKVRIIVDPERKLYREVTTCGYFNRGIQNPNHLEDGVPEEFEEAVSGFYYLIDALDYYEVWKHRPKFNILFLVQLLETDSPSDYWEEGQLYAVVGNMKVARALYSWLQTASEDDPEALAASLDPTKKGCPVDITHSGGTQGSTSFYLRRKAEDPLKIDETYLPLSEAYVKDGWDSTKFANLFVNLYEEYAGITDDAEASGETYEDFLEEEHGKGEFEVPDFDKILKELDEVSTYKGEDAEDDAEEEEEKEVEVKKTSKSKTTIKRRKKVEDDEEDESEDDEELEEDELEDDNDNDNDDEEEVEEKPKRRRSRIRKD